MIKLMPLKEFKLKKKNFQEKPQKLKVDLVFE